MIKSQVAGHSEMKQSVFVPRASGRDIGLRGSVTARESYLPKRKKYESSGSKFVNQMSRKVDKLLGRSMNKRNFKKRWETTGY